MNIAKALKKKSLLVGDITKLTALMNKENVSLDDNKSNYDLKALYSEYLTKVKELAALKTKIAVANVGIWEKIFTMMELKGMVAFLKGLDTKEGTFKESDYRTITETKHTPQLKDIFVEEQVKAFEIRIAELQDEIDEYNHITVI